MTTTEKLEWKCDRCPKTVSVDTDGADGALELPDGWHRFAVRGQHARSVDLCPGCSELFRLFVDKPENFPTPVRTMASEDIQGWSVPVQAMDHTTSTAEELLSQPEQQHTSVGWIPANPGSIHDAVRQFDAHVQSLSYGGRLVACQLSTKAYREFRDEPAKNSIAPALRGPSRNDVVTIDGKSIRVCNSESAEPPLVPDSHAVVYVQDADEAHKRALVKGIEASIETKEPILAELNRSFNTLCELTGHAIPIARWTLIQPAFDRLKAELDIPTKDAVEPSKYGDQIVVTMPNGNMVRVQREKSMLDAMRERDRALIDPDPPDPAVRLGWFSGGTGYRRTDGWRVVPGAKGGWFALTPKGRILDDDEGNQKLFESATEAQQYVDEFFPVAPVEPSMKVPTGRPIESEPAVKARVEQKERGGDSCFRVACRDVRS